MKKKTKNKKGGYNPCSVQASPNAFCRERAEKGPTEYNEYTVCDMRNGICVKPMRSERRQSRHSQLDAEEQRIREELEEEYSDVFGDFGSGGRKIFRRKKKRKKSRKKRKKTRRKHKRKSKSRKRRKSRKK
jgi:hypothetical protein